MTDPHTHDYWLTPSGALGCACGSSRRMKEQTMTELTIAHVGDPQHLDGPTIARLLRCPPPFGAAAPDTTQEPTP